MQEWRLQRLLPGSLPPTLVEGLTRLGTGMPFAQAAKPLEGFWQVPVSESTVRRRTAAVGTASVAVPTAAVERLEREHPAALGGRRSSN
jgi:hypothetical protein